MRMWRCRCGEHRAYGSDPPPRCSKCERCGSGLGGSPLSTFEVAPHLMVPTQVETDEGKKTLTRCMYCHETKSQIEQRNEPMEFAERV